MRSTSLVLAAAAGIAAVTFALPAGAFTPNSSAGVRPAAESIDPVASVHCRPFKHRSWNHPWSFGCGGGRVSVHEGVSIHERGGVRGRVGIHERSTTRSQTNIRSRERTNVRGEVNTGTRGGTSQKSSTTGQTGTTGQSSTKTGGGGGGGMSGQSPGGKQ